MTSRAPITLNVVLSDLGRRADAAIQKVVDLLAAA
jgi:hypothetical protein